MKIYFENKHLQELFVTGSNKRYNEKKIDKHILDTFPDRVWQIEAAKDIYDLMTKSLQYENLKGFKNRKSIRVNDEWRLEFDMIWENEEKTTGTACILELSAHYKKSKKSKKR